jgi:hypothetical protein
MAATGIWCLWGKNWRRVLLRLTERHLVPTEVHLTDAKAHLEAAEAQLMPAEASLMPTGARPVDTECKRTLLTVAEGSGPALPSKPGACTTVFHAGAMRPVRGAEASASPPRPAGTPTAAREKPGELQNAVPRWSEGETAKAEPSNYLAETLAHLGQERVRIKKATSPGPYAEQFPWVLEHVFLQTACRQPEGGQAQQE